MILILDACTISNLLHVVQDDSLIKLLNKSFKEVYIAEEVIKEVNDNKFVYLNFYNNSRKAVTQLIHDLKLNNYISEFDKDKKECIPFIRNFAINKRIQVKEDDGEFHSTLLSLYLSRWGKTDWMENSNSILFATDDFRARELYKNIFSTNQIGIIIDSIDILTILNLKKLLTKNDTLKKIEGVMGLYNFSLNAVKVEINRIKNIEPSMPNQLCLTALMDLVLDYELDQLNDTFHNNNYKKLYKAYSELKDLIKELTKIKLDKKLAYIKLRYEEISSDLLWTIS